MRLTSPSFKNEEAVKFVADALASDSSIASNDGKLAELASHLVVEAVQGRGSVDNTTAVIAVIGA